ncbi:hypothetical protein N566_20010 [Streptomycetaceae bacterium MP113-05]|nr:hypothetical protein N566_20010 [Streptomycetaceae bacterium MP113-05]
MAETQRGETRIPAPRPGHDGTGDGTRGILRGTATYEDLRIRAIALRRQGLSRRQIRDELKVHNNDLLNRLVAGEPPRNGPAAPRTKDDLRKRARDLRRQGWTYDRIQLELGVSKSSVSEERQRTKAAARHEVRDLSDRELFLTGIALYWAEVTKDKPHARRERVAFINSDPGVITLFLAWLDLLGVARSDLRFAVSIHESAEVAGAERYWAEHGGIDVTQLQKTTLKTHNPKTVRRNVGPQYRGCLIVRMHRSAELYRRIEGAWSGIVESAQRSARRNARFG